MTNARVCNCCQRWQNMNPYLHSHPRRELCYLSYIADLKIRTAFYLHHHRLPPKVSHQRLKDAGFHGRDDVLTNYSHDTRRYDLAFIESTAIKLDKERDDVREWAGKRVKTKMLARAINLNVRHGGGKPVRKFMDIKKSWLDDASEGNARKMYWVMFGDFEKENGNTSWSKDMERLYMEEKGLEYKEDTVGIKGSRGCYQRIMSAAKTTQVKMFNKNCKLTIKISRTNVKDEDGGQRFRRKSGDFFVFETDTVRTIELSVGKEDHCTHLATCIRFFFNP